MRPLPRFPASVVGSMPRSAFVRDLLELPDDHPGRRSGMDAASAYVIALQEATGIDVVSDGEWRRRSYIGVIAEIMVALPSPYLLAQRMWDPERSREAYPTRGAFMRALVPVLRRELLAVRDAGVTVAQFDDPHLGLLADPRVRAGLADPDAEAALCVDLLNEITGGVDGIVTAVHLCRRNTGRQGWVGEGGYEPIIPHLRRLGVSQYVLEFTIPVAGDLAVLRRLPDDRLIGLGCVDCRGERVDSPEAIAARVEQAVKHVDAAGVWLNPDCGFAPGSAADVPIDEAYAKLASEAAAARLLRERYPG